MPLHCPECRTPLPVPEIIDSASIVCPTCKTTVDLIVDPLQPTVVGQVSDEEAPAENKRWQQLGKFRLLYELGRGGFGTVYKALDTELGREVALKIPRSALFVTDEEKRQFLAEARKAAALEHPSIVPIYDAGEKSGIPYIVSKFVEGTTLANYKQLRQLTWKDCAQLVTEIADALHYAHEHGLVHRDVKPANVMVDRGGHPLLMDFGLAKEFHREVSMTTDGYIKGTPAYMSPEQAAGENHRVDRRTDVYSLGVVLYELLSDNLPFRGTPQKVIDQIRTSEPRQLRSLNGRIPLDLETISQKAMEKEPKRRYQTAQALADDLRRWQQNVPILARRVSLLGRAWRWCQRNAAVASLLAVIFVALVVGTSVSTGLYFRAAASLAESTERLSRMYIEQARLEDSDDLTMSALLVTEALALDEGTPREPVSRVRVQAVLDRCPRLEQVFVDHQEVIFATCSADQKYVITCSRDGTARVWDRISGSAVTPTLVHAGQIERAEFSPDGRFVATASQDGTGKVWEVPSGKLLATLHVPAAQPDSSSSVSHIHFRPLQEASPDQLTLLTVSTERNDGAICVWDGRTGRQLHAIWCDPPISDAIFNAGGKFVAARTGSKSRRRIQGKVQLIALDSNPENAVSVTSLVHQDVNVSALAFTPDGTGLVTGCTDGMVRFWTVPVVERPRKFGLQLEHGVTDLSFSADGRWLAACSADGRIVVAAVEQGPEEISISPLAQVDHSSRLESIAMSQDGAHVLARDAEDRVVVWKVAAQEGELTLQLAGAITHRKTVNHAEFVRGTESISVLTACSDQFARIWSLPKISRPFAIPNPNDQQLTNAAWDERCERFVVGNKDRSHAAVVGEATRRGISQLWNLDHKDCEQERRHHGNVQWADLSADGRLVATASADGTVFVWDIASGRPVAGPFKHEEKATVQFVAFDRNTRYVVTMARFRTDPLPTVQVWEIATGEKIITSSAATVWPVFHPTDEILATVNDGVVELWDVRARKRLPQQLGDDQPIKGVIFGPDGTRLVTWADETVRIWDWKRGRRIGEAARHPDDISSIAFSGDGSRMLVTSVEFAARVWSGGDGKAVSPFVEHGQPVEIAALNHNGRIACTATRGGQVRVWDAGTGEPVVPPQWMSEPLIGAEFVAGLEEVVTITQSGEVHRVSVRGTAERASDLRAIAELISGERFDESGGFAALIPDDLRSRWLSRVRPRVADGER